MASPSRLMKQHLDIENDPPEFCYAKPVDPAKNLQNWTGWVQGPPNTPYAGGKFNLSISFPNDYPFRPPTTTFITPIYHPNISTNGTICLDILDSKWSPIISVRHLLISLCSFLSDPNPDHGLNGEALSLYRTDKEKYEAKVKQWTLQHAIEDHQKQNS